MQPITTPTGKPVSFRKWISQHVEQETAFGDLARDIAADAIWQESGPLPTTSKLEDWMDHIAWQASFRCEETLRHAFAEYDAYRATVNQLSQP
jgi:hypothetical protein